MPLEDDLRKVLHGALLTDEELERHEEAGEGFHVPAIVHRSGGVSAKLLNTCGICGAQIIPSDMNTWIKVSDEEADRIRKNK